MTLKRSKVLFLFLDVSDIHLSRTFLENEPLRLNVIENRFHPPHHTHGIVKYDAGETILALNLAKKPRDDQAGSTGIIQVYEGEFPELQLVTAFDQHEFLLTPSKTPRPVSLARPVLRELWMDAIDLAQSVNFYQNCLDIVLDTSTATEAYFVFQNLRLRIRALSSTGRPHPVRQDCMLLVIYCPDIIDAHSNLVSRGVVFPSSISQSQIGLSIQFLDPSGYRLCLYQPSEESLGWESGAKVIEIMSSEVSTWNAMPT